MIDTELYRVFYTVACHATISAAAEKLFVSQPAVSKSLQKLEDLVGCTLFIRSSKGVRLTSEGEILFDYVKEGMEHLQNGERVLKKLRNREQGLVRVGISSTLCRYFFLPHLERFHQEYPGIRISIVNRTSTQTLKLLEKGAIDFGIISLPKESFGFDYKPLVTIEDIFVASGGAKEIPNALSLRDLQSYPLMMLEKDNVTRSYIDDFLAVNKVTLTPEIEIGSLEFLIEFARIGLGIALVIKNFVEDDLRRGVLREIKVKPKMPPRPIGIVLPKNLPTSTAAATFLDVLCS